MGNWSWRAQLSTNPTFASRWSRHGRYWRRGHPAIHNATFLFIITVYMIGMHCGERFAKGTYRVADGALRHRAIICRCQWPTGSM